jgi:hypothetical protein
MKETKVPPLSGPSPGETPNKEGEATYSKETPLRLN